MTKSSEGVAAALRRERQALGRYRSLLAAFRESLRKAEEHFSVSSDAIDMHVRAALGAMPGRGNGYRVAAAARR